MSIEAEIKALPEKASDDDYLIDREMALVDEVHYYKARLALLVRMALKGNPILMGHLLECPRWGLGKKDKPCTCGRDALLAAMEPPK